MYLFIGDIVHTSTHMKTCNIKMCVNVYKCVQRRIYIVIHEGKKQFLILEKKFAVEQNYGY